MSTEDASDEPSIPILAPWLATGDETWGDHCGIAVLRGPGGNLLMAIHPERLRAIRRLLSVDLRWPID